MNVHERSHKIDNFIRISLGKALFDFVQQREEAFRHPTSFNGVIPRWILDVNTTQTKQSSIGISNNEVTLELRFDDYNIKIVKIVYF